jgi:uncharacterized membrane protein (DUF106 family)
MLTHVFVWLNAAANALAAVALAPIAWLPGWLSATLIAVLTGALMLVVFKYTSNQQAIQAARNRIKANLLAVSLFQDDLRVGFLCQLAILRGAAALLALSVVPMLVMFVPMCLLLGQLALWYQARPLAVGEDAVVTVQLNDDAAASELTLVPCSAVAIRTGPVRVPSKRIVCWNLEARQPGLHPLTFEIGGTPATKEIAIGRGFLPTSLKRPDWQLSDVLLHPREAPFPPGSPVRAIEIAFPERESFSSGSDTWLIYWFAVSFAAAFALRPLLKVHV